MLVPFHHQIAVEEHVRHPGRYRGGQGRRAAGGSLPVQLCIGPQLRQIGQRTGGPGDPAQTGNVALNARVAGGFGRSGTDRRSAFLNRDCDDVVYPARPEIGGQI